MVFTLTRTHGTPSFYYTYLILSILISCNQPSSNQIQPADGISRELAQYRKKQVSDVIYQLAFSIPARLEDSIAAKLELQLTVNDLSQPLYLDFRPDNKLPVSVTVNDQPIPTLIKNEHLVIAAKHLKTGKNYLTIQFTAGEMSLNRSADFLYTLLVPARASTLFPCFDQPDIKASYVLNITAPAEWKVLAGAPLDFQQQHGSMIKHQFKPTSKISTYLFSFVAGKFEEQDNHNDDFPMRLLYRETDTAKIALSIPSVFELHRSSVKQLEHYTAYSLPFGKLDMAAIPSFQYGGMEHVGAIQYREGSIFLDSSATLSQRLNQAKLIAHESSHMWFGNLVTMKWFDDVWLKEVFANLMADKIINPRFPEVNHLLQFMFSHYPQAYRIDRTAGTHPIRQPLKNLNKAGSLYGDIIYHKAPIMMRQLEATLGQDRFQKGLRAYIQLYAFDNADWYDLIAILDEQTSIDLKRWSEIWVNSSGRPLFSTSLTYDGQQRISSLEVSQSAEDGSANTWPQLFEITLLYPDSSIILQVESNETSTSIPAAIGMPKPQAIIYNSNGFGYGLFPVSADDLQYIPSIRDEVSRGYSYVNCYENMLIGNLTVLETAELLLRGLQEESNQLILKLITNYLDTIFWKYLSPTQRSQYLPRLQELLWARLQSQAAANLKKDLFNLYQSVAYSGNGLEHLYEIWQKQLVISQLVLNQDDYTDLAFRLALYRHPEADTILDTARKEIKNPDRVDRFDFLLPAVSGTVEGRSAYFESFKAVENRAKENWVITACYYIHHPLRHQQSIKNLWLALELMEEIEKTGDIFFPKAWLDHTLGMYSSPEAMQLFNDYLKSYPDLDSQLKLKLWQSVDDLARSSHLPIRSSQISVDAKTD